MADTERWPETEVLLHLAQRADRCTVLGPGVRAVLWVQGCPFRCPGCVAPETLQFAGGEVVSVESVAREVLELKDIVGVTFSGGEPMSQAAPLARLIDRLTGVRPELTFMCYTGHTLNHLRAHGDPAQLDLLARLDILIDGPYVQGRHADLRWRGSDNQQIHFLSPRSERYRTPDDHAAGIEFEILPAGGLRWMGVPALGFRDALPIALARFGIHISTTEAGDERLS